MTHPPLPKSYKNAFPFRLAAPAYVYPGDYALNIRLLGPFVDEIEILLFESLPENALPSPDAFAEMARLSREFGLTFNVHLPIDVSLSHPDLEMRETAVKKLVRAMDAALVLDPVSMTLHMDYHEKDFSKRCVKKWRERVDAGLQRLLDAGAKAEALCVETLDYPFEIIEDAVLDHGLSICLDVGHLALHGYDIERAFDRLRDRISIVHLHGVRDGRDHLGLDRMDKGLLEDIIARLKGFSGSLCLETFSYEKLKRSLETLEKAWGR